MKKMFTSALWLLVAVAGAWAYVTLAFRHGEHLNSVFILIAALCSYAIGYRFYSKWIAARALMLDDRRATPCEAHDDGKDFVRTNKWIVFGHHFAAISGPGPLVGPVLAAQFGYLPGTIWILIGVTLGGAVQDFVVLFASMRRNGKSLGQMVKEELNTVAGTMAVIAVLAILVILLAVLGLVVVKALAESPWGVFTVGATVPIAILMGFYMRFVRVGKVLEASAMGVVLLLLGVWGGKAVHSNAALAHWFSVDAINLAWIIILYGLAASVLPVWLLLAPRDYLSTFMKLGTIFALALGIFCVLPILQMPAVSQFVNGTGPVVAGKVFPFCFITIACGAISGFHTLIASGTTPKLITRESYARPIGYGAMCLESLVAIMALIAACTLDPGVYLSMNIKGDPAATVATVNSLHFSVTTDQMTELANKIGEKTLFGRTGGATTLAVGMAQIFSHIVGERWIGLWYHFAIMFEALFILTTLDAGTRVGRYLLQDALGNIWRPLGETRRMGPNLLASALMVGAWGWFLIQGVLDENGGINSLWPLFGIANQMLAGIALCLVTTILLKMGLREVSGVKCQVSGEEYKSQGSGFRVQGAASEPAGARSATFPLSHSPNPRGPALALVTLVPLGWLLAVTMTAGVQKIWHSDPRIGFFARASALRAAQPALKQAVALAKTAGDMAGLKDAQKGLRANAMQRFNNLLDAGVAATFLILMGAIVLLSAREWVLLLARRKLAVLRENEPVWLPHYALAAERPLRVASLMALGLALFKELSGETEFERAKEAAAICEHKPGERPTNAQVYRTVTDERFNGIRRCC
ncbi:MAG: carbon starvation protein A [Verrucomicrobia bacterium]|nr:MAG: carbon starvation protein A [Verrucomicrobiota bacterium]